MRSFGITLVVVASLSSTVFAEAGLLPTKASQLVSVGAGGACPIIGHPNAAPLQNRLAGDGTTSVLVIPPKQVLVLTDIEMTTLAQTAGHVFLGALLVGTSQQSEYAAFRYATVDASGAVSIRFTPPNGIVVKPGIAACIELVDSISPGKYVGTIGYANGFLAPDK